MSKTSVSSKIRIAFAGFRHGHIHSLYQAADGRPDLEIVAAAEEDAPTRQALQAAGAIRITHSSIETMLDEVPCEVVAVGDYYGRRGSILIDALRRGKHVIGDKPLCTSLAELDRIEALARGQGRVVGCQLDMRDAPVALEARRRLLAGEIGEVHAISVGGQHPLLYGTRPGWYFEPGKHGGTINDIGIHALDALPWMTGLRFQEITFARAWNARLSQAPQFQDGAQFAITLSNGAGVLADVSYLAPDAGGYRMPQYWRMTFWGSDGLLETDFPAGRLTLHLRGDEAPQEVRAGAGLPGGYLESFLREIRGETGGLHLSSAEVLAASRLALRVQEAADQGLLRVLLE
jgi:predicted dehydrogenase